MVKDGRTAACSSECHLNCDGGGWLPAVVADGCLTSARTQCAISFFLLRFCCYFPHHLGSARGEPLPMSCPSVMMAVIICMRGEKRAQTGAVLLLLLLCCFVESCGTPSPSTAPPFSTSSSTFSSSSSSPSCYPSYQPPPPLLISVMTIPSTSSAQLRRTPSPNATPNAPFLLPNLGLALRRSARTLQMPRPAHQGSWRFTCRLRATRVRHACSSWRKKMRG
jgi:hypothetical protein